MSTLLRLVQQYWLLLSSLNLIILTTLSLWPLDALPGVPGTDKSHHLIAYAALIFPVALRAHRYLWPLAFAALCWSGMIELIQPLVNRYGDWLDMAANLAGLGLGVLCGYLLQRWLARTAAD